MKTNGNSGFTLIELLIVIGLLGALTALVLPSLTADREEALGDVCDYNQAGTVRVLKQYNQLYGIYPDDLHTGLDSAGAAMGGLPMAQSNNFAQAGTIDVLTADEAASLSAAGIDSLCSDTGLTSEEVAAGVSVTKLTADWEDDGGNEYSFDGRDVDDLLAGTSGTQYSSIIVLWIAPTTDWSVDQENANKDWTGGNVELGIDLEGQCPIPAEGVDGDPDFSYYMAYFGIPADGSAAELLGTSCPECGIMNP